jgi:acyl-coenzyme A thioesterase PaaI-like protein
LSGEVVAISAGRSWVRLETTREMAADEQGLVHGGFVFSLADHCAMLAVNEPNVVLASADMEFLAPVAVGAVIEATGRLLPGAGRRHEVEVVVEDMDPGRDDRLVARGRFRCVVTKRHVLAGRNSDQEGPA